MSRYSWIPQSAWLNLGAEIPEKQGSIPCKCEGCLSAVCTGRVSGMISSVSHGHDGSFAREENPLPPFSVDIKKEWSYTSIQWVLTPVVCIRTLRYGRIRTAVLLAGFIFVKCQPWGKSTYFKYIANKFLGKYLKLREINNRKIWVIDHFACYTE